jgi:hypothetical protein
MPSTQLMSEETRCGTRRSQAGVLPPPGSRAEERPNAGQKYSQPMALSMCFRDGQLCGVRRDLRPRGQAMSLSVARWRLRQSCRSVRRSLQ